MDYTPRRGPRSESKKEWSMPLNAKWYKLYQTNSDFKLWFDNLARGSPTTALCTLAGYMVREGLHR